MKPSLLNKIFHLLFITSIIAGCAHAPSSDKSAANPAAGSTNAATEGEKATPKSIAVTDISYKKEHKDFFYFEDAKSKLEVKEDSQQPDVGGNPSPDALNNGQPTSGIPALTSQDTAPDTAAPIPPAVRNAGKSSSYSKNLDSSYTKKYGFEQKVDYGEIRGLSGSIRGLLIKSGYKVVQAKPSVAKPDQNDQYFDIVERIKAGDFNDADYVLFGVLAEISNRDNVEHIEGTNRSMQQNSLDISVDFSLIDTKTYQVIASFTALGSGNDLRIDGNISGYKPSIAKMMQQISSSLAEDVSSHLADQNFITSNVDKKHLPEENKEYKKRLDNDSTTLKIYK